MLSALLSTIRKKAMPNLLLGELNSAEVPWKSAPWTVIPPVHSHHKVYMSFVSEFRETSKRNYHLPPLHPSNPDDFSGNPMQKPTSPTLALWKSHTGGFLQQSYCYTNPPSLQVTAEAEYARRA